MDGLLTGVLRRLRPQEGWLLLVLVAVLAFLLSSAVEAAAWVRGLQGLWMVTLVALYVGLWLSRRRWPVAISLILALAGGVLAVVQWTAAVLPSVWNLAEESVYTVLWVGERLLGSAAGRLPWLQATVDTVARGRAFWQTLLAGGNSALFFRLIVGSLVWAATVWMSWSIFRTQARRAFLAVLPAGVLLATNAFFDGMHLSLVAAYLVALLALLAWRHWYGLRRAWESSDTDYPSDLALDGGAAAGGLIMLAVVVAVLMPPPVVRPLTDWYWRATRGSWQVVERRAQATFPDVIRPPGSHLAGLLPASGLPRAQLLGSGPELAKKQVFRVVINYQIANFRPYWKQTTYAQYTGRGWRMESDSALTVSALAAGRAWASSPAAALDPLAVTVSRALPEPLTVRQRVEALDGAVSLVVAMGVPVAVDQAYRAIVRGPDDLVALQFEADQARFAVTSLVEVPAEQQLRVVNNYTNTTIYTSLPKTTPLRIQTLAEFVTSSGRTTYDKARLLEAYLRTIPYDLDVPMVSPDRDLVDAFLFDIRRGYCDYFASAFVVMARSLGIPARLAVGYAPGTEETPGQWVVSAADAHSWPEVYFAGSGWVPFEPTPSQEPSRWPAEAAPAQVQRIAEPAAQPPVPWLLLVLAGIGGGLLVWSVARVARAEAWPADATQVYERIATWGERLGRGPLPSETPREYGRALRLHLESPGGLSLAALIQALFAWCEAALYALPRARPQPATGRGLWQRWQRTWPARLRLWLRAKLKS